METTIKDKQKMTVRDALNIWLLDIKKFITDHRCWEVTTPMIMDPHTGNFHDQGLYSESIFGPVNSDQRRSQFGAINLYTSIMHPLVYLNVVKLGSLYDDVLRGKTYAFFDPVTSDLVKAKDNSAPNSGTGYSFFIEMLPKIKFPSTGSATRDERIKVVTSNPERNLVQAFPVLPAALRDVKVEDGRIIQEEINNFYTKIIGISRSLKGVPSLSSTLYDPARVMLQDAVVELYQFLMGMIDGKYGFAQGQYGSRSIALGTRNVIAGTPYIAPTAEHPQAVKHDETQMSLFTCAKGLSPVVTFNVRSVFFDFLFGDGTATTYAFTDQKTLKLVADDYTADAIDKYTGDTAIDDWLDRFGDPHFRHTPLTIKSKTGKQYYLVMVYDTGKEVSFFRTIDDLYHYKPDAQQKFVRPMTWFELFYIATYRASRGRHVLVTRYPVTLEGSTYPTKIHPITTVGARVVNVIDLLTQSTTQVYPQYPTLNEQSLNGSVLTPGRLAGLGGDYDGDMVSQDCVLSEEANAEVSKFLNSLGAYINSERQLVTGGVTDTCALTFFNLSCGILNVPEEKRL